MKKVLVSLVIVVALGFSVCADEANIQLSGNGTLEMNLNGIPGQDIVFTTTEVQLKIAPASITTLDLSNNGLSEVPAGIEKFTGLVSLQLNSNSLTTIPDAVCNLTSLDELLLQNNPSLNKLPDNIGNLISLGVLNLQNTGISSNATEQARIQASFAGRDIEIAF
jgi:Leucine-rich repeat (LRR) protein